AGAPAAYPILPVRFVSLGGPVRAQRGVPPRRSTGTRRAGPGGSRAHGGAGRHSAHTDPRAGGRAAQARADGVRTGAARGDDAGRERMGGTRSPASGRDGARSDAAPHDAVDRGLERRFLLVTGEASGDLHAARLVEALRSLGPCRVRAVAGPALRAAGAECVVPAERLAVVGFAEVLSR